MVDRLEGKEVSTSKGVRRLLCQIFLLVQREEAEVKQQQTMAVWQKDEGNKGWTRKTVSELLADDCKKTWPHCEWEDALQHWYTWLHEKNKKE